MQVSRSFLWSVGREAGGVKRRFTVHRPGSTLLLQVLAALTSLSAPAAGSAGYTVVDQTRININMAYDEQTGWELNAHDEFSDALYEARKVLFYVSPAARVTMPDNGDYAFIGADPGSTIWVLTQVFDPAHLSVGVSAEEISADTFASYYESDPRVQHTAPWVKLTMKAVRGPGQVSVWQPTAFGQPVVWIATSDGIDDNDALFVAASIDADFNWAFTAPGVHEIDFVASAYLPGEEEPVYSEVVTYTFGVETRHHDYHPPH
jgi:surface-anchored protein